MDESPAGAGTSARSALRRLVDLPALRVGVVLVAAALGVAVLVSQWDAIREDLSQLSVWTLVAAVAAAAAGLSASVLAFRAILADLGSKLPYAVAFRVLLVGQLGKYVPGSVWAVLGPGEVARPYGVPRTRSAVSILLVMAFAMASGLLLVSVTLPFAATGVVHEYAWVLAVAPILLVCLHPALANRILAWLLRVSRRPPMEHPLSWRGIALGLVWSCGTWTGYGLALGMITAALGVDFGRAVLIGIGGFALAWIVGFLVVIAPAGAGVREAVLVAALAPVLDAGSALFVALVDRAVVTLAELGLAGIAAAVGRRSVAEPNQT